jgi:hypothetical protein
MYTPSDDAGTPGSAGGGRNGRYAYLVGRLRTRQITMEEATELFGLQQAALSRSEAARLAALAQASATSRASLSTPPPLPPPPSTPGMAAGGSDDFLIVALLAMGAGAGLLAAMTRKIQEGTLAPAPGPATPSKASSSK